MEAKVLRADAPIAGLRRNVGDVLNDDDLKNVTRQSLEAMVNQGILDIPGFGGTGSGGLSSDDRERIQRLQASVEKLNEAVLALPGQLLEAIKTGAVKAPKVTKRKRAEK